MSRTLRRGLEVVGADVLDGLSGPFVLWVHDGTPALIRRAVGRGIRPLAPGRTPRRSGPPVAIFDDGGEIASAHLQALLPVPVIPVAVRGAGAESAQLRFGSLCTPEPTERPDDFVARLRVATDGLAAEESVGWWQVARGAEVPSSASTGWRRHWSRTAPRRSRRQRPTIWA